MDSCDKGRAQMFFLEGQPSNMDEKNREQQQNLIIPSRAAETDVSSTGPVKLDHNATYEEYILPDVDILSSYRSSGVDLPDSSGNTGIQPPGLNKYLVVENSNSNDVKSVEKQSPEYESTINLQSLGLNDHCFSEFCNGQDVEQNTSESEKLLSKTPTKKRVRDPSKWARNIRKKCRAEGKPYITRSGRLMPKKSIRPPCSCRRKCNTFLNKETRSTIFKDFYKLTFDAQKLFISENVLELPKKVQRVDKLISRRTFTRKYFFVLKGKQREVCQKMFLNTLSISNQTVRRILTKRRGLLNHSACLSDQRGKHGHQKKLPANVTEVIIKHISSFIPKENLNSQGKKERIYLSSDLSIAEMYRLYTDFCSQNNFTPANEWSSRKIFNEEFNLTFHKPESNVQNGTFSKQ